MSQSNVVRVAIVDDHDIVRSGLSNFLRVYPDLALVGEAKNGAEALTLCESVQPDVLLMDLMMPGMNGVETTQRVRARFPQIQVLVLTSFDDDDLVHAALEAGAIGYLLKNVSIHEMAKAIRAAHSGYSVLSPEATTALVRSNTKKPEQRFTLKEREREVLNLMAQGLTNPEIAEDLSLSVSTIKFYVSSILEKLDVKTRTEAVALALQHGLIP